MAETPIDPDQICALMSFSVGTLEGRDAMMVLEYAPTPEDLFSRTRNRLLLAMTPDNARRLAEGLLAAAQSASMGEPPTKAAN